MTDGRKEFLFNTKELLTRIPLPPHGKQAIPRVQNPILFCSENDMEHINTLCGPNAGLLMLTRL
jgi:hypothetical protein